MKPKYYLFLLFIFCCNFAWAQFNYTGGPEDIRVSHLMNIGDTLLAVCSDQVFFDRVEANTANWISFNEGLPVEESLIKSAQEFNERFFIIKGQTVFSLKAGAGKWMEDMSEISPDTKPQNLINVDGHLLMLSTYNAKDKQYYWYQYNFEQGIWTWISQLTEQGFGYVFFSVPNGNILAMGKRELVYTPSEFFTQNYRILYDASIGEWQESVIIYSATVSNRVVVVNDTLFYAGSDFNGVVSKNGGKSWNFFNLGVNFPKLYQSDSLIYGIGDGAVVVSIDRGDSWDFVVERPGISAKNPFLVIGTSFFTTIDGKPQLFYETNGDYSQFPFKTPAQIYITQIRDIKGSIYFYGFGGMLKQAPGDSTLVDLTANLSTAPLETVKLLGLGNTVFASAENGFYALNENLWQRAMQGFVPPAALGQKIDLVARKDTLIFFDGQRTQYSTDQAKTWNLGKPPFEAQNFLGFANTTKTLYAGFDHELYQWKGNTTSWVKVDASIVHKNLTNLMAFGDTLLVAAAIYGIYAPAWYRSIDGQNWENIGNNFGILSNFFHSNGSAFGTSYQYTTPSPTLLFSLDANGRLRQLGRIADEAIENIYAFNNFIVVMPIKPPNYVRYSIYRSQMGKVIFSFDKGKNWQTLNTEAAGHVHNAFISNGILYLAGEFGVWQASLQSITTGLFNPKPLHPEYALKVWPNPGDGLFQLEDAFKSMHGSVLVRVCNLQGQVVLQNVTNVFNSTLQLDLHHLESGVYWISLSQGEKNWLAKIVSQK